MIFFVKAKPFASTWRSIGISVGAQPGIPQPEQLSGGGKLLQEEPWSHG